MADRSSSQKTGSQGHKWLLPHVEDHPQWLSRELNEDFGIDAEFELSDPSVAGDILKVQIKATLNKFLPGARFAWVTASETFARR